MQIGLDSFALHPLNLPPLAQLEWTKAHGFAGIQFGDVEGLAAGNAGRLEELRAAADGLGLYTHVSVGGCNPLVTGQSCEVLAEAIMRRVELAARFGWHELHGVLGGPHERFELPVSWPEQLALSAKVLAEARPALRQHGSRVSLETHGDATTFELVRLAEQVGPDVVGICLDTANVLLHGENPVRAARRAAPYTHLTHCKDAILFFIDTGVRRQTLPLGQGVIDWRALVAELAACQPDLKLSIEDHKWFFDGEVFRERWRTSHPDVPRDEVLEVLEMAWQCHQRIARGELRDPAAYEEIPYGDEVEERLSAGRDHLERVVAELEGEAG